MDRIIFGLLASIETQEDAAIVASLLAGIQDTYPVFADRLVRAVRALNRGHWTDAREDWDQNV